jgi:hypothetical protein
MNNRHKSKTRTESSSERGHIGGKVKIDVWRAANQLIQQSPEDPILEAAWRADQAYEAGDMFNFRLWTRITKAVGKLLNQRPDGRLLN